MYKVYGLFWDQNISAHSKSTQRKNRTGQSAQRHLRTVTKAHKGICAHCQTRTKTFCHSNKNTQKHLRAVIKANRSINIHTIIIQILFTIKNLLSAITNF